MIGDARDFLGLGDDYYKQLSFDTWPQALRLMLPTLACWVGALIVLRSVCELLVAHVASLYKWPCLSNKRGTSPTCKSIVSIVCATVLTQGAVRVLFFDVDPTADAAFVAWEDVLYARSELSAYYSCMAIAYFVYELATMLYTRKAEIIYVGHHLGGITGACLCALFGWASVPVVFAIFWELSNIPRHLRQVLLDSGVIVNGRNKRIKLLLEVLFAVTFCLSRCSVGVSTNYRYGVAVFDRIRQTESAFHFVCLCLAFLLMVGMQGLSFFWAFQIACLLRRRLRGESYGCHCEHTSEALNEHTKSKKVHVQSTQHKAVRST
ncbi:MAG: hypothetical protein MHM6MM_001704 [Cercozoa sp. M6MM]